MYVRQGKVHKLILFNGIHINIDSVMKFGRILDIKLNMLNRLIIFVS